MLMTSLTTLAAICCICKFVEYYVRDLEYVVTSILLALTTDNMADANTLSEN